MYELAEQALAAGRTLTALVAERVTGDGMDYAAVYAGVSPWRLLPPIDHPAEPTRCLVSGTGLTHMGSARDRQAMHTTAPEEVTDSMRMFRSGLEGGRPEPGRIGTAPEWFYKGTGTILRAHGEPLLVPSYAEDGGEEAEVAGVYLIDAEGRPRRLGMAVGNEFSDHRFERKNYLNLAGSKLRTCAWAPSWSWIPASTPCRAASRSSVPETSCGRRRFAPVKPRCATACRTSSTTISSSRRTAAPATSTCTSSARTA